MYYDGTAESGRGISMVPLKSGAVSGQRYESARGQFAVQGEVKSNSRAEETRTVVDGTAGKRKGSVDGTAEKRSG